MVGSVDMSIYSDLYKDVYGIRPVLRPMTDSEYFEEMQRLSAALSDILREEEKAAKEAWESLISEAKGYSKQFNISLGTALRWIMESDGENARSVDSFLYFRGISYTKEREFLALLEN